MISNSSIPIYLKERFENDSEFKDKINQYCENFGYFANFGYINSKDVYSYINFFVNVASEDSYNEEYFLGIEFVVERKYINGKFDYENGIDNTIKFADDMVDFIIDKVESFLKEGVEYDGKIFKGFSINGDRKVERPLLLEDDTQVVLHIYLPLQRKKC